MQMPKSPVMWCNGTFLTPQHFQQTDRYLEGVWRLLQRADNQLCWGVLNVRIDPVALTQGRLKLDACQAFLPPPDGAMISVPDGDEGPPERSFSIPDGVPSVEVFLTLPAATATDRYVEGEQAVADIYSATSVRPLKVTRKNLALAVSGEPQKNLAVLKLAEIERDAQTGKPVLRAAFVPPCLLVSAAPGLQQQVRELLARMAGLCRGLPEARRLRRSDEVMLFLHTVNQHLAPLGHLIQEAAAVTHPAVLFEALLRLGAGLSSFFDEPPVFPRYDHANPTRCFSELRRQLDALLGFCRPPEDLITVLRPKLDSPDNRMWLGKLPPGKPAADVPVLVALRGELPAARLIGELENKGKLAPAARIMEFVGGFATGVPFHHETHLPARQQAQPGVYYRINTSDPLWDEVCKTGELAVYIPSLLRGDKLPTVEVIYAGVGEPASSGAAGGPR